MCGIFGELSLSGKCLNRVINGIGSLEHRGYDSMGVVYKNETGINVAKIACQKQKKTAGDLYSKVGVDQSACMVALGHTRWATLGEVSEKNAHPHKGTKSYIVHNGNVNNLDKIKSIIKKNVFVSETDSEAAVRLIDQYYEESGDYVSAIGRAINIIGGANSFVLFNPDIPDRLFCASNGGPLLIGKTKDSVIVASDTAAFSSRGVKHDELYKVEYIAVLSHDDWQIVAKKNIEEPCEISHNGLNGFEHYMLKEIFEQTATVENAMRGRMDIERGNAHLGGLNEIARDLRKAETFHFVGCGTAYNACLYGTSLFNRFGMDARAWIASEFIHNHPYIKPNDVFIFVSQSGETADTIEVLKEIKMKGNICLGILNVQNSRIAEMTDAGVYIRSGVEKGVASTKAFTGMMAVILLYAVFLARQRKMTIDAGIGILKIAKELPSLIERILEKSKIIEKIAQKIIEYENMYFMGRSFNHIVAMEGSLKLKEISYRHAEAYPLGEMKHGPLALISPRFCSVVIAPNDSVYSESMVNIGEVLCRHGKVFRITSEDVKNDKRFESFRIPSLPQKYEFLYPFLTVIPLQLISYYSALLIGNNPDRPRNLAKSVTVN